MRIGFVELVLLLFIASITVGPNVALFVDRWLRRAQRTSAAAARRKAQLEAQAAIEREALMTRFRVASNIFALLMLAALVYGLLLRIPMCNFGFTGLPNLIAVSINLPTPIWSNLANGSFSKIFAS